VIGRISEGSENAEDLSERQFGRQPAILIEGVGDDGSGLGFLGLGGERGNWRERGMKSRNRNILSIVNPWTVVASS
jgi:hypothetical protein